LLLWTEKLENSCRSNSYIHMTDSFKYHSASYRKKTWV